VIDAVARLPGHALYPASLVAFWAHECRRVFSDRCASGDFATEIAKEIRACVTSHVRILGSGINNGRNGGVEGDRRGGSARNDGTTTIGGDSGSSGIGSSSSGGGGGSARHRAGLVGSAGSSSGARGGGGALHKADLAVIKDLDDALKRQRLTFADLVRPMSYDTVSTFDDAIATNKSKVNSTSNVSNASSSSSGGGVSSGATDANNTIGSGSSNVSGTVDGVPTGVFLERLRELDILKSDAARAELLDALGVPLLTTPTDNSGRAADGTGRGEGTIGGAANKNSSQGEFLTRPDFTTVASRFSQALPPPPHPPPTHTQTDTHTHSRTQTSTRSTDSLCSLRHVQVRRVPQHRHFL
jgi:hypothetical protein